MITLRVPWMCWYRPELKQPLDAARARIRQERRHGVQIAFSYYSPRVVSFSPGQPPRD